MSVDLCQLTVGAVPRVPALSQLTVDSSQLTFVIGSNYQLPITNSKFPIPNSQLPIPNYQLPIFNG
ncbi:MULTISPECIES: hypothetical protein [unclassified Microcoleus]|uniref:hypothetical protein n=1 Tax=unclassified Microcoleus TaxID=2642155 RepID=UPI002FCE6F68